MYPVRHGKPPGRMGRRRYAARKNTAAARELAILWQEACNQPFPGSPENAWLRRLSPTRYQKAAGHYVWELLTLNAPHHFLGGSPEPVRECFADPGLIEFEMYTEDEPVEMTAEEYRAWANRINSKFSGGRQMGG